MCFVLLFQMFYQFSSMNTQPLTANPAPPRNLSAIQDREICCYSISCKEKDNIDITLQWLITKSKSGGR